MTLTGISTLSWQGVGDFDTQRPALGEVQARVFHFRVRLRLGLRLVQVPLWLGR